MLFVGRDRALARLLAAVEDAAAGNARLVLVSGEAGMGKTTLVGVAAARSGLAVGWGTGAEAERTPAFWPWTAALRALLSTVNPGDVAELTGADAAELARLLPQLADGSGAGDPDSPTDAGPARLRLFDAVARFLEGLARRRPTLVVLDDLQWADESSLQLLEFITQPVRSVPLVIVGAYRHDELATDAARLVARIATRGESLPLHGLSAGEVFDLVAAAVGSAAARCWAAEVHRRSGGHPFLARQLAEVFGRSGSVRGWGTGWSARPAATSDGCDGIPCVGDAGDEELPVPGDPVRTLIRCEFTVSLSPVRVGRVLRTLGLSRQRPLWRAWQADPDAVARWRDEDFPAVRAQAKAEGATIYFGDQAGIGSDCHAGTTWPRSGSSRWLVMTWSVMTR